MDRSLRSRPSLGLVGMAATATAAAAPPLLNKTIPGPNLGSPPPFTTYTTYLQQDITGRKHSFLAGNNVYYMSGGRWGNPGHPDDETLGLGRPFFHDLRSRGTGIAEYGSTGKGNDFWGWDFHKWVEVARGTVIGGAHTGGPASGDLAPLTITDDDGALCLAAHPTQDHYGLPVTMEPCDREDARQRWTHDAPSGLFTNEARGWCLFAGRPDLVGQALKTWGCDAANPQMVWDFDGATGELKSRRGFNAQYSDGKCVEAGLAPGDAPATAVCDGAAVRQRFDLLPTSTEVRYEDVTPDKVWWRPDGMSLEYTVGPAQIPVREEMFVAANDVISTTVYADVPIEIEFTGKSFARADDKTVSKSATCEFDPANNAVRVAEGGRVLAKVSESPEVVLEADLMYGGMSTVLSSSRAIDGYAQVEISPGECRYTFRLPVDSAGTTLSWTMHDDYATALDATKDVLSDPVGHMTAKTDELNHLLNYNVPFFRCDDEDIVKVYYYLWSIYLMLFKYVGKGQEVRHHTQTAVNNFLGMHNWDAVMQILVGSWTADKPTWAYGNVLLWSELPLDVMSGNGMVPDNMGQTWNSGLFGGFHHAAHACGALQIYEHAGDLSFLLESYTFFDNLFTDAGGVLGEDFDASICLAKMAAALGRPDAEVAKWDEHMERYGGLDWYLSSRWDGDRSCWMDCDEASPGGIHRWGQVGKAYQTYFPDDWARQMGEEWLTKDNPDGFYPADGVPFVSVAKRDWDKVLCPGKLDSMSCGDEVQDKWWSEFAVTPDTNYYMIQGMFRHNVPQIAVDAALGHLKLNNMQWGMPVAPESREADFALWGDQYSNFNAGKILMLIEGIGGFKLSLNNSTFTQSAALPVEWSFMEWRLPVRAASAAGTTWVLLREERLCSGQQDVWTKRITIESNPFRTLVINPWTEGATVISSELHVGGQESDVQAVDAGQDRLGFIVHGEDAKKKITISVLLQADSSADLSNVKCTQCESCGVIPTPNPTGRPTTSSTIAITKEPTNNPSVQPSPNPTGQPTTSPTSVTTKEPTNNPTPAPISCAICDDRETNWQIRNGFDCATDTVRMKKKCNTSLIWTTRKYCRLSCYRAGNGYPGDVCCNA